MFESLAFVFQKPEIIEVLGFRTEIKRNANKQDIRLKDGSKTIGHHFFYKGLSEENYVPRQVLSRHPNIMTECWWSKVDITMQYRGRGIAPGLILAAHKYLVETEGKVTVYEIDTSELGWTYEHKDKIAEGLSTCGLQVNTLWIGESKGQDAWIYELSQVDNSV